MPTYLERYLNGEHEAVWQELIALGEAVRQEPVYADARAVAQETMRRARHNIETLVARLRKIGYQFDIEDDTPPANPLDAIKAQFQGDDLLASTFGSLLSNMEQMMEDVIKGFGESQHSSSPPPERHPYMPPPANVQQRLDDFERRVGPVPLSVRAWCEMVGTVDFCGTHPGLAGKTESGGNLNVRDMVRASLAQSPLPNNYTEEQYRAYLETFSTPFPIEQMVNMFRIMKEEKAALDQEGYQPPIYPTVLMGDPLVIRFDIDADEILGLRDDEDYADWVIDILTDCNNDYEHTDGDPVPAIITIAPDSNHKANFSGASYDVLLPNAGADLPIMGLCPQAHFVEYLRKSFAWGGFPGLADDSGYDRELVASLKEGLLPL